MTETPRHPMPDSGARGCFVHVDVTGTFAGYECPGLLLEWRPHRGRGGGWEGLVIYASRIHTGDGHNVELRQAWVRANLIRRA